MGALLTIAALLLAALFAFFISFLFTKRRTQRGQGRDTQTPLPLLETPSETALLPPPPPVVIEAEKQEDARKKKRGRKKRRENKLEVGEDIGRRSSCKLGDVIAAIPFPFSFPFSSYASVTPRKIKLQYDELVKSNQAKALTMAQVGKFVNCLVNARNELQHKSKIVQRSFKIKKALLFKADRSSFDRLCQQIYKLEAEHKRLEEDAAVYNLLQEQLKLSPAYKTMLEVGASVERKDDADEAMEFSEISFEELLAQEKKDSFWQRNGRFRSVAS